jgi:hypothetical protein
MRMGMIDKTKSVRTPKSVGSLVCIAMISASLMVSVIGCKPKAGKETQTAAPAAQAQETVAAVAPEVASPAAKPAPSAPKPAQRGEQKAEESAAAGKSAGITGGWVNAGGACDSGAAVMFNADGTYLSEGEKGTWALSGKTLTVTTAAFDDPDAAPPQGPEQSPGEVGEKSVLTVLSITDDAARVVLSNGTNANWTRCNG